MTLRCRQLYWLCVAAILPLAACGEPPPRTFQEFLDDPVLLEATLLRCRQEGEAARADANCENARRAAARLAAEAEATRRAEREAASARMREERRRREEAEAEARRRAEDAARRAEEEAYEASWILPEAAGERPDTAAPRPSADPTPPTMVTPDEAGRTPVGEAANDETVEPVPQAAPVEPPSGESS